MKRSDVPEPEVSQKPETVILSSDHGVRALRELSQHRARQVILGFAVLAAFGTVMFLLNAIRVPASRPDHQIVSLLVVGSCILGLLAFLAFRSASRWIGEAAVVTSVLVVSGVMWLGAGIRDTVVLAIPVIIVLTAVVASHRWFVAVSAGVIIEAGVITALEAAGIYSPRIDTITGEHVGYVVALIAAQALTTAALARDVRTHLRALEHEKNQAAAALAKADEVANFDPATKLPNRRFALSFGEALCRQAEQHGREVTGTREVVAVVLVEVADLSVVTQTIGEQDGDNYINQIAVRMHNAAGGRFLARVAPNEFAVLLVGQVGDDEIGILAARLLEEVSKPLRIREIDLLPAAAAGIARFPDDGRAFRQVLSNAVRACVDAQMQGPKVYRYFDEGMERRSVAQLRLIGDLRAALDKGGAGLWIAYQPHVEIVTGRVFGVEALLRWEHPRHGLLPTAQVIELAESSGLIVELGEWVLRRACKEAASWKEPPLAQATLSVNISPAQFERSDVVALVKDALKAAGLPAERLTLEFTEGLMLGESAELQQALQELIQLKVELAIDDFGTGYSNIGYLQRFEIHTLKLDRSFVVAAETNARSKALAHAVVALGTALDMRVVAEGVETRAAATSMLQMGCRFGQGHLWARPARAGDLVEALKERPKYQAVLEMNKPF